MKGSNTHKKSILDFAKAKLSDSLSDLDSNQHWEALATSIMIGTAVLVELVDKEFGEEIARICDAAIEGIRK